MKKSRRIYKSYDETPTRGMVFTKGISMLENWSPVRILAAVLGAWALTFVVLFLVFYWLFLV